MVVAFPADDLHATIETPAIMICIVFPSTSRRRAKNSPARRGPIGQAPCHSALIGVTRRAFPASLSWRSTRTLSAAKAKLCVASGQTTACPSQTFPGRYPIAECSRLDACIEYGNNERRTVLP